MNLESKKATIAKLLAKAEGAATEAERDTHTEKAEKLMVSYGIEAAELEAAGEVKPEKIVQVSRQYKGGYAIVMVPFAHSVAAGFGNLKTLQSKYGQHRSVYIIGHESDVEMFTSLLNSLEHQAMAAMHTWQRVAPERKWQDNGERYIGSRTFLESFGSTVGRRLAQARREETAETTVTPGAALVLASKQDKVDAEVARRYPKMGAARGGAERRDYSGAAAGREAGNRASLGNKGVGGRGSKAIG